MRNTLFVCILMSLIPLSGMAQPKNVDVDNVNLSYVYRSLPNQPLNPIHFKYATKVNSVGVAKNYISMEEIADAIKMEGQIKVEKPDEALLTVELSLGNIVITSSNVIERKSETKDKNGNVTNTYYYYKVEVSYNFDTQYKVLQDEKILEVGSALNGSSFSYSSSDYSTRQAAADFWNNNRDAHISNFYISLSRQAATSLSSIISSQYGFKTRKKSDHIKTIDTKKHAENTPFRAATDALKAEIQAMTADKPMSRDVINPLIEYFKSIPKKYTDPKLKADVRLRYTAWWNLCKIYLYLDEPENVAQYADLIAPNGYDEKDGAKLKKEADELKAIFETTGIHTSHFDPDDYFATF